MPRTKIPEFMAGTCHGGWLVRRWGSDIKDKRDRVFTGRHLEAEAKEYAQKLNRQDKAKRKPSLAAKKRVRIEIALADVESAFRQLRDVLASP